MPSPDAHEKDDDLDGGCLSLPFSVLITVAMLPWMLLALIMSGIFAVFGKADDIAENTAGESYRNLRSRFGRGFEFLLKAAFATSILVAVVQGCTHLSNSERDCEVGRGGMECR